MRTLATWADVSAALRLRQAEIRAFLDGCVVAGLEEALPDTFLDALDGLNEAAEAIGAVERHLVEEPAELDGLNPMDYSELLRGQTEAIETLLTMANQVAVLARQVMFRGKKG